MPQKVVQTYDGGKSWNTVFENESSGIISVFFFDSTLGWLVGGNGTILHYQNDPSSVIPNQAILKSVLMQNYPNPFNRTTTIKYNLQKSDKVSLIIYNISGQELKILVDVSQEAGEYEITWQPKGLPSGIYFWKAK